MGTDAWRWLVYTDAGLALRIALGVVVFAALATSELRHRGGEGRRWREYLFLLAAVGMALLYGIINDQVTATISWEYFYYGKELGPVLGDATPPSPGAFRWEVAKVGMKATWSAGLILGVVILLANNPRPRRGWRQLSYRELYRLLPGMLAVTVACAAALGTAGYAGWLAYWSEDFRFLVSQDLWRPARFMCVFGIHLGGYVGGGLGALLAAGWIVRRRGRTASPDPKGQDPAVCGGQESPPHQPRI